MDETQEQKQQNIDQLLDEKLKPLVQEATTKALGITVNELTEDITAKLVKTPFIDFQINTSIKYKQAKRLFKKAYLQKMLELNLGNISEVADIAGAERRSIHRLINQLHINVHKIKEELIRPYDLKISAVSHAIEDVLAKYIPEKKVTLKEAEEEFERKYLQKALEENQHNITRTAKKIGLRYETLQRKMKALMIR